MAMATTAFSAVQQAMAKASERMANGNIGTKGMLTAADGLQGSALSRADNSPFAEVIQDAIRSVDKSEQAARVAVEGLISGAGVDVHTAMIASEKAEMGFELVLAVRNKALAAYQQVMGMQF